MGIKTMPPDASVVFDDELRHAPGRFHSYRGYYEMIAIDYSNEDMPVSEFLEKIQDAIGETFEGYKGGNFKMNRQTPVWASEYGASSGIGVIGVENIDGYCVLKTCLVDE